MRYLSKLFYIVTYPELKEFAQGLKCRVWFCGSKGPKKLFTHHHASSSVDYATFKPPRVQRIDAV